jgi:glycosyltransferase involved in cell wall biosynthesis
VKIVIDARELRATGAGTYLQHLLEELQSLDHNHTYAVLLKPEDMDSWTTTSRRFKKIACPYKEFSFAEQIDLLRLINRIKPDLVHFGMTQQPVLYRGKVVTTMHDLTTARFDNPSKNWLVFRIKQLVYKLVIKRVARKSAAILTPSDFVKEDIAKFAHVNSRKITVTYEAADKISDPPEPLQLLKAKEFIMYVGRPTPHKNLERLVEAFAILKETHFNLTLVLAGKLDANYKQLQKLVDAKGIAGVFFTDFVTEGELRWLYEHAKAYVFPSLSEGFGLPGLEAMAHGCPLISSNATCLPEIYKEAAHYFDPLDVTDMATKINEVLADPALAQKLVIKGSLLVKDYSWAKMAQQTLDVYKTVLGERVTHSSSSDD